MDVRRYTLFALACAELDATADPQAILSRIAEGVAQRTLVEDAIPTFEPTRRSERLALVDALALLEDLGVLRLREGSTGGYVDAGRLDDDPFYDVDRVLLASLASPPVAPARATSAAEIGHEDYPPSELGDRARARHALYRRLVDDPVTYDEDLADGERSHFATQGAARIGAEITTWTGMTLERRAEGATAVDVAAAEAGVRALTDITFPAASGAVRPHVALLLASDLADLLRASPDRVRHLVVQPDDLRTLVAGYIEEHRSHWPPGTLAQEDAAGMLAADAAALLAGFGLLRRAGASWRAMPAIARFAPVPLETADDDEEPDQLTLAAFAGGVA